MLPIANNNLLQYFPFLLTLTPLVLFWQQSRNFILKIFRIFWKQRTITDSDVFALFFKKLYDTSFVITFDDFEINGVSLYHTINKKWFTGFFKLYKLEIFLYKYFIPIFISGRDGNYQVSYLKYTFNFNTFFEKILKKYYENCSEEYDRKQKDRFYIEEIRGRSLKSLQVQSNNSDTNEERIKTGKPGSSPSHTITPYIIKLNQLNNRLFLFDINQINWSSEINNPKNKYIFTKKGIYILNQVEKWIKAKNWYEERNINFRRGVLLNGRSGSGKSALILEIAKKLGIPLYMVDLSTFENQEFCKKMDDLGNYPGIVLFEDIDSIWDGRTNLVKTEHYGGLTFDCFLNKLSGVKGIRNKFIFITTNHLEKMDSALLRSGRIDEVIDLPCLNREEQFRMASIILDNNKELVDKAIKNSENLSTADFENKVVEIALNHFWKNR